MSRLSKILSRMLNQTAVYWAVTGKDRYNAKTFAEPTEIACRWEEKQTKILNSEKEEVLSSAIIYIQSNLTIGGFLYLGEISDIEGYQTESSGVYVTLDSGAYLTTDSAGPRSNSNTKQIIGMKKIPDIKGQDTLKGYYLL